MYIALLAPLMFYIHLVLTLVLFCRCHVQYLNEERIYYIRVQVVDINKYCGKLHFSPVNKRHTFDFDMYQVNACTLLY